MTHFAKVNNGVVVQVIVAEPEFFDSFVDDSPGEWIQTSYNTKQNQHPNGTPLRGNYAGVGFTYDRINDVFIPPKPPYDSWVLNTNIWDWEAPVPMPADSNTVAYDWNEETQSWNEVTE